MSDEKRYGSDPTYPAMAVGKRVLRTIPPEVIAEKLRHSTAPPMEIAMTIEENQNGPQESMETLVRCPVCKRCTLCGGAGLVSATVAASYTACERDFQAVLTDESDTVPPPAPPPFRREE